MAVYHLAIGLKHFYLSEPLIHAITNREDTLDAILQVTKGAPQQSTYIFSLLEHCSQ